MDYMSLFKEYGFDVGSVVAILMLTPVIRALLQVNKRYVTLIPVVLGALLGILNFMVAGFGEMVWYQIVGGILKQGIVYAGIAMGTFNIYRKSILNQ